MKYVTEKTQMKLCKQQEDWISRHRRYSLKKLRDRINKQKGLCYFSKVKMFFDKAKGTPVKNGKGCHPLYASVDHENPGDPNSELNIVCYALNDLKGCLPEKFFAGTKAWKLLMEEWQEQAKKSRNRTAFKRLIKPNA